MKPVFPLGKTFLPGERIRLNIFEPRYIRMFADMTDMEPMTFVTVLIERGSEVGGGDGRFDHGVQVRVHAVEERPTGLAVHGMALGAVRVISWNEDDPYPSGTVEPVRWESMPDRSLHDAASAIALLAQSVRVLLAKHGVDGTMDHPDLTRLAAVASGQWHGASVRQDEVQDSFWTVARSVPCGPLDRYGLLCETTGAGAVRLLRTVVEHTDEIMSFGMRDER